MPAGVYYCRPNKAKGRFAAHLKQIGLEPDKKSARRAATALMEIRRRSRVVGVFPSAPNLRTSLDMTAPGLTQFQVQRIIPA